MRRCSCGKLEKDSRVAGSYLMHTFFKVEKKSSPHTESTFGLCFTVIMLMTCANRIEFMLMVRCQAVLWILTEKHLIK